MGHPQTETPAGITVTESLSPSLSTLASGYPLSRQEVVANLVSPPSLPLPGHRGHRARVPKCHLGPGTAAGWPHFCSLLLALLPGPEVRETCCVETNLSPKVCWS